MKNLENLFFHPTHSPTGTQARIFLFSHAGAGASYYMRWKKYFDPTFAEVYPVQLPGRENRAKEPLIREFDVLTDQIVETLAQYTDMPYAFFGHSLGASVCYDTAVKLRNLGLPEPECLILSANRPPVIKPDYSFIYSMSDASFCTLLQENGAMHGDMLESKEFREAYLPVIRSDFELYVSYDTKQQTSPLHSDIYALCGDCDPFAAKEHMELWKDYTTGSFQMQAFHGGHFYLNDHVSEICEIISNKLHAKISRDLQD